MQPLKLALTLALLPAGFLPAQTSPSRPNIILAMADDLGWGDLSSNADTPVRTPCLAEMAAAGLRFTRFYAAAPVCSPTRGSALTGRHPFRYGIFFANVGHLPPEEITLAEVLREEGYSTGHFGKWHLGTLTTTEKDSNRGAPGKTEHFSPPWKNGFEVCFSTEAKVPTWDPAVRPARSPGGNRWWNPVEDPEDARPYGTAYWNERGEKVSRNLEGDDSRLIMDRALGFIEQSVEDRKPFFAVIWFHAPHLPVVAGRRYAALYPDRDAYARHYNGCVTALDEQMGRLRRKLRQLDARENTLLWFCSDNGPEGARGKAPGSAGPLRGRKRSLLEGGVRVPGLLEWPARVKPGGVTDFPAVTSDYLPTVLDLLDRRLEPDGATTADTRPLDGISLLPVILDRGSARESSRSRPIAFESGRQVALIDGRYKLLRGSKGDAASRLFDLQDDPGETTDLASKHPEVVERLEATLKSWRSSCTASRQGADYP